uniref:Uncharacterized protein n=1 Tax=Parastrongyloides trichosuri TaxID=131310 RepID=A0A0N4ZUA1_PARTI
MNKEAKGKESIAPVVKTEQDINGKKKSGDDDLLMTKKVPDITEKVAGVKTTLPPINGKDDANKENKIVEQDDKNKDDKNKNEEKPAKKIINSGNLREMESEVQKRPINYAILKSCRTQESVKEKKKEESVKENKKSNESMKEKVKKESERSQADQTATVGNVKAEGNINKDGQGQERPEGQYENLDQFRIELAHLMKSADEENSKNSEQEKNNDNNDKTKK